MKTFISMILLLLALLPVFAQDSPMEKANQLYSSGNYQQAAEVYQEILNSNQVSAELYYNLGNAYYKTGNITKAIINYERAKLLAPGDDDIQFNLELANQHVVDAIEPLPQVFFVRWWHNLLNKFPVDEWAWISIISFILTLGMAGFFLFSRTSSIRRLSFWTGILMLAVSIFSFNFAARQKKRMTSHNFAIISQPSATVKSSPSESGTDLFLIHEGLKVEIRDSLGNWMEIRLADGNQGWLPVNSMEKI